jgi:GH15 family glucan-1,4-alpha-glucosidase
MIAARTLIREASDGRRGQEGAMFGSGVGAGVLALVLLCAARGSTDAMDRPMLLSAGVAGMPGHRTTLAPDSTAAFVPGTSLIDGAAPLPAAGFPADAPTGAAAVAAARSWLAAGRVPGRTDLERAVAARALSDLALLTAPDGAAVAGPFGSWDLVWPRDASWYVAALSATGHVPDAVAILGFLARTQNPDGTWAARYHADGRPVRDGRPAQLDAVGWFGWAVWSAWRAGAGEAAARMWPAVVRAADFATAALGPDGLPRPAADYWERPERRPTLGTAAPLLLGLRAAADLATARGARAQADRWTTAAQRLSRAIVERFGPYGYGRHPGDDRPDAAVAFLSAPLARLGPDAGVAAAVAAGERALLMPSGGLRPGVDPRIGNVAWTAETALFALADSGDDVRFEHWFGWLVAHRTRLEEFPEKVTDAGQPASVAPLGWTDAIVLLALAARDGRMPTPPAPDLR